MNVMSDPETIFKAFGDMTRLRILGVLQDNELCVCEIEASLSLSQPNASRSLAILKTAGIIESRKQAQWTYYKISDLFREQYPELDKAVQKICADLPSAVEDMERYKNFREKVLCTKEM